ncbi:MAG: hypothetical protein M1819_005586 [Sarea resinae]|nr:MAG: hypothetical protein M1819_005586 [Sarea resinae]
MAKQEHPPTTSYPTYTPEQLSRYFDHISLPESKRFISPAHAQSLDQGLSFLRTLQKYQVAKVPFENLSLHYTPHHSVSIDPQHVYHKVVDRGWGGYCMENNLFFGTVLRSLGFSLYPVGGRVSFATVGRPGKGFGGWSHMVNLVTFEGKKYMVDVGFGSNEPTHPLPLVDGEVSLGIGPQTLRLVWSQLPQNTNPEQKMWIFQTRKDDTTDWQDAYCFADLEFWPEDFGVINYLTSTSPQSFFTYRVVCVRFLMEDEELIGTVALAGGDVRRRVNGKREDLMSCETEEQRIAALERHFEIILSQEQQQSISGMPFDQRMGWRDGLDRRLTPMMIAYGIKASNGTPMVDDDDGSSPVDISTIKKVVGSPGTHGILRGSETDKRDDLEDKSTAMMIDEVEFGLVGSGRGETTSLDDELIKARGPKHHDYVGNTRRVRVE